MAVKIKLSKMGRLKKPFYRIVVMEQRSKRDGRYLDKLGYYNPLTNPPTLKIDREKLKKWIALGAKPTESLQKYLENV